MCTSTRTLSNISTYTRAHTQTHAHTHINTYVLVYDATCSGSRRDAEEALCVLIPLGVSVFTLDFEVC